MKRGNPKQQNLGYNAEYSSFSYSENDLRLIMRNLVQFPSENNVYQVKKFLAQNQYISRQEVLNIAISLNRRLLQEGLALELVFENQKAQDQVKDHVCDLLIDIVIQSSIGGEWKHFIAWIEDRLKPLRPNVSYQQNMTLRLKDSAKKQWIIYLLGKLAGYQHLVVDQKILVIKSTISHVLGLVSENQVADYVFKFLDYLESLKQQQKERSIYYSICTEIVFNFTHDSIGLLETKDYVSERIQIFEKHLDLDALQQLLINDKSAALLSHLKSVLTLFKGSSHLNGRLIECTVQKLSQDSSPESIEFSLVDLMDIVNDYLDPISIDVIMPVLDLICKFEFDQSDKVGDSLIMLLKKSDGKLLLQYLSEDHAQNVFIVKGLCSVYGSDILSSQVVRELIMAKIKSVKQLVKAGKCNAQLKNSLNYLQLVGPSLSNLESFQSLLKLAMNKCKNGINQQQSQLINLKSVQLLTLFAPLICSFGSNSAIDDQIMMLLQSTHMQLQKFALYCIIKYTISVSSSTLKLVLMMAQSSSVDMLVQCLQVLTLCMQSIEVSGESLQEIVYFASGLIMHNNANVCDTALLLLISCRPKELVHLMNSFNKSAVHKDDFCRQLAKSPPSKFFRHQHFILVSEWLFNVSEDSQADDLIQNMQDLFCSFCLTSGDAFQNYVLSSNPCYPLLWCLYESARFYQLTLMRAVFQSPGEALQYLAQHLNHLVHLLSHTSVSGLCVEKAYYFITFMEFLEHHVEIALQRLIDLPMPMVQFFDNNKSELLKWFDQLRIKLVQLAQLISQRLDGSQVSKSISHMYTNQAMKLYEHSFTQFSSAFDKFGDAEVFELDNALSWLLPGLVEIGNCCALVGIMKQMEKYTSSGDDIEGFSASEVGQWAKDNVSLLLFTIHMTRQEYELARQIFNNLEAIFSNNSWQHAFILRYVQKIADVESVIRSIAIQSQEAFENFNNSELLLQKLQLNDDQRVEFQQQLESSNLALKIAAFESVKSGSLTYELVSHLITLSLRRDASRLEDVFLVTENFDLLLELKQYIQRNVGGLSWTGIYTHLSQILLQTRNNQLASGLLQSLEVMSLNNQLSVEQCKQLQNLFSRNMEVPQQQNTVHGDLNAPIYYQRCFKSGECFINPDVTSESAIEADQVIKAEMFYHECILDVIIEQSSCSNYVYAYSSLAGLNKHQGFISLEDMRVTPSTLAISKIQSAMQQTLKAYLSVLKNAKSSESYKICAGILQCATTLSQYGDHSSLKLLSNAVKSAPSRWLPFIDVIYGLQQNIGIQELQDCLGSCLIAVCSQFPEYTSYLLHTVSFAECNRRQHELEFYSEIQKLAVLPQDSVMSFTAAKLHELYKIVCAVKSEVENAKVKKSFQKLNFTLESYHRQLLPFCQSLDSFITDQEQLFPLNQYGNKMKQSFIEPLRALAVLLKRPLDDSVESVVEYPIDRFKAMYQKMNAAYISLRQLKLEDISTFLTLELTEYQILVPGQSDVYIQRLLPEVLILQSKTKPKKISMVGTDGQQYTFLLKGMEDLNLEQRIMQFFKFLNATVLRNTKYSLKTYNIIPLGNDCGLVEWISDAVPFYGLYRNNQMKMASTAFNQNDSKKQQPVVPPNPVEQWRLLFRKSLASFGLSRNVHRHEVPSKVYKNVWRQLSKDIPRRLIADEHLKVALPSKMLNDCQQQLTESFALSSIVSYILGIGDRHLDNILIDFASNTVVHIDFNLVFDMGQKLRIPEIVPFRLTENIVQQFGSVGLAGKFTSACVEILQILRDNSEIILDYLSLLLKSLNLASVARILLDSKKDTVNEDSSNEQMNDEMSSSISLSQHGKLEIMKLFDQEYANTEQIKLDNDKLQAMVMRRVSEKIFGLDRDLQAASANEQSIGEQLNVSEQVELLIQRATDKEKLAQMYEGWTSWI
ncbi:hypothetical protein MIR68_001100 [Amoeboaphelidium protococcarum]|nr:hypothetical protein MIR68_001100 [Amoeboaphelidium protococcarum]